MNWWREGAIAAAVFSAALVLHAPAADNAPPIENVRLPLESHPNGRIKTQLHARLARVPSAGPIRGEDVVVESFDEEGGTQLVVTAVSLTFDRAKAIAESSEAVQAVGQGIKIDGNGFDWDVKEQVVVIRRNARVEFDRAAKRPLGVQ